MKNIILILTASLFLFSCASSIRFNNDYTMNNQSGNSNSKKEQSNLKVGSIFKGKASYYADKYDGRKTASGETFDQDSFTAAHRTLAFGTKCRVTNLKNGKSVIVTINDRGPFIKGRVIDLSKSAAIEIDMVKDGVVEVEVEVLE